MAANDTQPIAKTMTFNAYTKLIGEQFNMDSTDMQFVITNNAGVISVFPAHKKLLSMLSVSFRALFDGKWKDKDTISIPDVVTNDTFKEFLRYFYHNSVEMTEKNVYEILFLAKEYGIDDLIDGCLSYMMNNITVDNAVAALYCASIFQLDALRDESTCFIGANTGAVLQSSAFLRCNPKTLQQVLSIEPISCSEADVFDACMEWAEESCDDKRIDPKNIANRRKVLDTSFALIRFREIDPDAFDKRREIFKQLFTTDELLDLYAYINKNASNANKRQLKVSDESFVGGGGDGCYAYDFKQIASAEFGYKATNVILFSMSKAAVLTALRLSNIFIETTDDMIPFPLGVMGTVELYRVDPTSKTLISKWHFDFIGVTPDIQIDLREKQILHRDQIFELNITATDKHSNGHKFIRMHQLDCQMVGGIEMCIYKRRNINPREAKNTDIVHDQSHFFEKQAVASVGSGVFVSGLRFEKFDINSLKLLEIS